MGCVSAGHPYSLGLQASLSGLKPQECRSSMRRRSRPRRGRSRQSPDAAPFVPLHHRGWLCPQVSVGGIRQTIWPHDSPRCTFVNVAA
jgi:hypothetical protein